MTRMRCISAPVPRGYRACRKLSGLRFPAVRIAIGDTHLFFDVEGPKLVPAGSWMVERPTLLLLHPGPGFDHTVYKLRAGEVLGNFAQVVYLDQRGHGRS